jgi:hypothetical protein
MNLNVNYPLAWMYTFLQKLANSRFISLLLLCSFFWIVAAASFSGFVGKWGLRDGEERFGVEAMIDATAHKPFIYRQLMPSVASFLDAHAPEKLKNNILAIKAKPELTFVRTKPTVNQKNYFQYILIYYFSFLFLFLSLFVLRKILLDFGIDSVTSIVAPTAFVLAFPYLMTVGGYFYDSSELFFVSLAFLIAARGKILFLIALALPATLNKETFFFILPTLYPLLRQNLSKRMAMTATCFSIIVSGLINVLLKINFSDAPGGIAEIHFYENIKAYLLPWNYRQFEVTYGVAGPAGAFFGTLIVIAVIVLRGLPNCPPKVRQHLLLAAAINLPLFVFFCATGELRNLSLLFVGFVILTGLSIDRGSKHPASRH